MKNRISLAVLCLLACFCCANAAGMNDSITVHQIDAFRFNQYVETVYSDSIFECDEQDGLMFNILTDSTAEFANYRNDSIIRIDSLIIPEYVSSDSKRYKVVGIAESALVRSYTNLMGVPYDSNPDMSYYGPSYLFIPPTVKYIAICAFGNCANLKTVILSEGLDSIDDAFGGTNITEIHIPSTVRYIYPRAFENCMSLEKITVSPENPTYDSRNGCNAIIETETDYMFITCKNTVFPDNVKKIQVTNNVPKVKLGSKSSCEGLYVETYAVRKINARRCDALKRLRVSFNHEPEVDRIVLPPGIEYLHIFRVDPGKVKGRIMKRSGTFQLTENYDEKRSYIAAGKLFQLEIKRAPEPRLKSH